MDPLNSSSIPIPALSIRTDDENYDEQEKDGGYGTLDRHDVVVNQSFDWTVNETENQNDVHGSNDFELMNSRDGNASTGVVPQDEFQPTPIGVKNCHVVKDGAVPFSESILSHSSSFIAVLQALNDSGMSKPTHPKISSSWSQIHLENFNSWNQFEPVAWRLLEQDDSSCSSMSETSQTSTSSSPCTSSTSDDDRGHSMHWNHRFQELVAYHNVHGHCNVPYRFRQPLSEWVKRQRHQYKLKMEGKHSNLTEVRQAMLERLGFVWDSRESNWNERYQELYDFYRGHGHVRIPQKSPTYRPLSIWLKRQRRACRTFLAGGKFTVIMTEERMSKLKELGVKVN